MCEEFKRSMQDITRTEILDGIEDAKKGELSPHWQEYIRRETQSARENGYLPDDAEELLHALQAILDSVPQMSDTDLNKRQLAASNTELLYDYPSDDYGTLLEITYMPDSGQYAASVFLDPDAAQEDVYAYAKTIEQTLWAWVHSQKIDIVDADIAQNAPKDKDDRFDNLKAALQYVFSALRHPETLL